MAQESEKAQAGEPLDLADESLLASLFRSLAVDIFRRAAAAGRHQLDPVAAANADKRAAAFLAATLLGHNAGFVAKKGWTGAPLAAHLRTVLADRFAARGIPQDDFKRDESVLQAAAFEFTCDVYSLIRSLQKDPDHFETRVASELPALCGQWAARMLGKEAN